MKRIEYTVEELARKALRLHDHAWAPGLGEAEQIIAATLDALGLEPRPEPPRMPEGLGPSFFPVGDDAVADQEAKVLCILAPGDGRAVWIAHAMNEQARREREERS